MPPPDISIFIARAAGDAQFLAEALSEASEPFTLEALCELLTRAEQLASALNAAINLTIDQEDDSL